jgi:hypothetical protein
LIRVSLEVPVHHICTTKACNTVPLGAARCNMPNRPRPARSVKMLVSDLPERTVRRLPTRQGHSAT